MYESTLYIVALLVLLLLGFFAGRVLMVRKDIAEGKLTADKFEQIRLDIERLRSRLDDVEDRLGLLCQPADETDPVYADAKRLLQQGISEEDVAGRLGITRAEVDLLAALYCDPSTKT